MGPLPKTRISKTRQARKRARYLRVKLPHMVECTTCRALHVSHTVCANCGTYNGVSVIEVDQDE